MLVSIFIIQNSMKLIILAFFLEWTCSAITMLPMQNVISFSGRQWRVRDSKGLKVNPGPNYFSNSKENVWVDDKGFLHLKVTKTNGAWNAAQVFLNENLGYGRYIVYAGSRIDQLDKNAVLGIFTYDNTAPEDAYREIDIELSRWSKGNDPNAQFAVQPYKEPGNLKRFPVALNGNSTTHIIDWTEDRVKFTMLHGHYPEAPNDKYIIQEWTYDQKKISKGRQKFCLNLWLMSGLAPSDKKAVEAVIVKFEFIPH